MFQYTFDASSVVCWELIDETHNVAIIYDILFFFIAELQKSRNARRYDKTRVKMIDNEVKVKMLECVFCCV